MSKLRRKSKSTQFKKNVKKTMCCTMTAATILAQIPYAVRENVYGAVSVNASNHLSGLTRAGQTSTDKYVAMPQVDDNHYIDISKQPIADNKITITLGESGDYVLTGTNLVDEVYVDTQIVIPEGAEVNLWLDGADINNDDGRYSCGQYYRVITPFQVEGILNLYMEDTSVFTSKYNEVFEVSDKGVLNIMASKDDAALNLKGAREEWYNHITGEGQCNIYGGNVDMTGAVMTEEFYMEDGSLDCGGIHATDIRIDGGVINADINYQNAPDWPEWPAGIGIGYERNCDSIEINGGIIKARGFGDYTTGIGTSSAQYSWDTEHNEAVDVTINGGTIYAYGGAYAYADIGVGHEEGSCGVLTINGGNIVEGDVRTNPMNVSSEAVYA